MTKVTGVFLSVVLLLTGTSCIKRASTGQNVTPYEQVMAINAALGATNRSVLAGVVSLNNAQAGSQPVLSDEKAAPVIRAQGKIAVDHIALSKILLEGPTMATNQADQIKLLVDDIKNQITPLINNGDLGVKNPTSQANLSNELNSVSVLTDILLVDLKNAGVLK